ncbi:MAG TPA: hypothetical protein DD671_14585 [Balneolaceae bacterium]|nr:hypothetical protein [Balneolaceae bacterium]
MLKLKIPPALLFLISVGLMWIINKYLPADGLNFRSNMSTAIAVFSIGVLIGLLGVWEFIRHSTTVNPHKPENANTIVTTGIYKFSRNPMYVGLLIGLAAAVIYFGNPWTAIILPLFIWYMNVFQVLPEEKMMKEKFGKDFREYKSSVRRWI